MFKVFDIDGKKVPMAATAATAFRYKQVFKKDLLEKLRDGIDTDTYSEMAYIMAKAGAKADMNRLSFDDFMTWLDEFSPLTFITKATAQELIDFFEDNQQGTETPKKKAGRLKEN